jgi:hypothetical protein
MIEWEGMEPK